jgi:hypothetical protein
MFTLWEKWRGCILCTRGWHLWYFVAVVPSSTYLFTAGVEVVYFHLITLRHSPQSVRLLWTRDRPVAETSTWQHKHCTRDKHPCPRGIRTHDPSQQSAADPRLRPRGYWNQHVWYLRSFKVSRSRSHKNNFPENGQNTLGDVFELR